MLLSIMLVVSATSVSAADVTVALKKPTDRATWYVEQDYTVTWALSGDVSRISSIDVFLMSRTTWDWSTYYSPGQAPPTSCVLHVTPSLEGGLATGLMPLKIDVSYVDAAGVEQHTTDSHQVKVVDNVPPVIGNSGATQMVIFGAADSTGTGITEMWGYVVHDSIKVTVDGKPAPNGELTIYNWMGLDEVYLDTDWLSLGKHKVTVSASDYSGNTARASWIVQVVKA